FDALPATRALADALPGAGARRGIAGLPGSSAAVLLAALARRRAQRVFVVVTATPTDAERWLADLQTPVGDVAALYPQREALRGGILDVYGFGMAAPARVEWWGDDGASIRAFDLDSQRSGEAIERITVLPVKTEGEGTQVGGAQYAAPLPRQSLLDLLPSDAVV